MRTVREAIAKADLFTSTTVEKKGFHFHKMTNLDRDDIYDRYFRKDEELSVPVREAIVKEVEAMKAYTAATYETVMLLEREQPGSTHATYHAWVAEMTDTLHAYDQLSADIRSPHYMEIYETFQAIVRPLFRRKLMQYVAETN
jgi:hypothetical protein